MYTKTPLYLYTIHKCISLFSPQGAVSHSNPIAKRMTSKCNNNEEKTNSHSRKQKSQAKRPDTFFLLKDLGSKHYHL